jgi:hypothetical protein
MLGAALTFLFAVLTACAARRWLGRWTEGLDPAEAWGVSGLVGLGLVGTAVLVPGLAPGGLRWGMPLVGALVAGAALFGPPLPRPTLRRPGVAGLAVLAACAAAGAAALVGALGPSDARDWDTLAYHLAVPKLWLSAGSIGYVPAIHHSNFPFAVDNLYLFGLAWGGEPGAKAFAWSLSAWGVLAAFGAGRRLGGENAGWLAALLVAGMPVVAWESGTAYVDVVHGLFSGLGTLYFAEAATGAAARPHVAGLCLGLALGTKHTGLAALAAAAALVAVLALRGRKTAPLVAAIALAASLGAPWYAKSWAMTGNPVFPFFYSVFGGREWSTWRAEIYSEEQASFGPGTSLLRAGHNVLGLAYQPGRYVNPGQSQGAGFPTGALGGAVLACGLAAAALGGLGRERRTMLALVALQLGAWFVLSQQSRYLVAVGLPLALVAGAARERWRSVLWAVAGAQAVYTAWLCWEWFGPRFPVAAGAKSFQEHRRETLAFASPAEAVNSLPRGSKVALYDEVFGFLLDRPYVWANPGHSDRFGPEGVEDADDWIAALRREGATHVYVNFSAGLPEPALARWFEALGYFPQTRPYTADERGPLRSDPNMWWRVLLADALQAGRLERVREWATASGPPRGLLLRLAAE